MKHRKPFDLKSFILVYNLFNIVFNGFVVANLLGHVIKSQNDPFQCFEGDSSAAHRILMYYMYNKLIDLIETAVFVLRKKESQVSFLHLMHHAQVFFYAHHNIFAEIG